MSFVISKPVNHGFTVLLGHDPEATRIAREALDRVRITGNAYIVYSSNYEDVVIYGVFSSKEKAIAAQTVETAKINDVLKGIHADTVSVADSGIMFKTVPVDEHVSEYL